MSMNCGSSMQSSSMRNEVTDPVTLTNDPQNSTTSRVGYPKVILYTKFEQLRIIRFELCRGQTNRQTDKQTEPMPTDSRRG